MADQEVDLAAYVTLRRFEVVLFWEHASTAGERTVESIVASSCSASFP